MQVTNNKKFFFLLSFIEGACVMATELLGAKMLAPYFGSSLYVWATVLAITLGGLAAGYFAGGILSYKSKNKFTLFYVLIIAAAFTVLMPFTSRLVLWAVGSHSLISSVIVCSVCILFPPVFMMGMVSPLIIKAITTSLEESGKAAGAIYAISTAGGIISTFAFGFYIIPTFGLTLPAVVTGLILGIIPLTVLLMNKQVIKGIGFIFLCLWAFTAHTPSYNSMIRLVYQQEGLLGQLLVLDYPHYSKANKIEGYSRWLFVNRISQTMFDSLADENNKEEKYFPYVYRISSYLDSLPKNTNVLLLGLGGGSIAKQLLNKGFNVDVCELDQHIVDVAHQYFHLSSKASITVDDARHYIKTCTKKYDVIVFDTFKGEDPPNHVFTIESLQETKKLLSDNGIVIINSLGYINGSIGKSMRSIYKTFLASGFNVRVLATDTNPDENNILFYASMNKINDNKDFIAANSIDLNDAVVLKDEYPVLDILNAEAAKRWRILAIQGFNYSSERSFPVFK